MKFRIALCVIPLISTIALSAGGASKCVDIPVQSGSFATGISPAEEEDLTIVSLNMAKEKKPEKILRDLRKASFFDTADVWLLQEAVATVKEIARVLGLNYAYAPADDTQGLAILSRYPIEDPERTPLSRYNLVFKSRCRIALSAKVNSLRIVNIHLDSRIGRQQRLDQVAPVLHGEKMIVGGDFNTANVRWVGHILPIPFQDHAETMRDLFVSHGFESPLDGAGKTFKLIGLPLHLDWIFPKDLKTVASGVEEIDFSDHHAVWVAVESDITVLQ
jgi:endonuclease/exonuclease/phosphatase family metal-dependent hydrolase